MTTAYIHDNSYQPLKDSSTGGPSNPYDHGAGHINPSRAVDPGLIYDIGPQDYFDFLCTQGLTPTQLVVFAKFSNRTCQHTLSSPRDLKSHLFRYQGHVSAALVLGGVDAIGPHLHTIYPHGSTDTLPYATMSSGSLAAMSIFESEYHERLTRDEGVKLVAKAIRSGIFNDLGSGSNVDVCVIEKVCFFLLVNGYHCCRNHGNILHKDYMLQV